MNLTAKTLKKELKEEAKEILLTPLDVCPELKTGIPEPPELVSLNANKMYFDFIHFGALALKITLHIEPQVKLLFLTLRHLSWSLIQLKDSGSWRSSTLWGRA